MLLTPKALRLSLKVAHILFENDEPECDEITKEIFMNLITVESIFVYPDGKFQIYYDDGDIFWGHCIIVEGDIKKGLSSAEIAG